MKTIFKVGMKVYDQVCFPNKEGVIVSVDEEWAKLNYPCIKVKFEGETSEFSYTNKGCLCDNYYWIPTLSTKPYTLQGFEQKAPAPTYEEVIKEARSKGDYYYLPDSLETPSEELVDATIALLKLLFLKDYYNEGWQPDWNKCSTKYCIEQEGLDISAINQIYNSRVMCFETEEIRDKFLEEQKELLEIAKPLL